MPSSRADGCSEHPREPRPRRVGRARRWAVLLLLVPLGACGGARVSGQTQPEPMTAPAPSAVLVETASAAAEDTSAAQAAATLGEAVIQGLREAGMPSGPLGEGAAGEQMAVLRLQVTSMDEGSRLERLAIGFGLGQSRLRVQAELLSGDAPPARVLLSFQAEAHSGYKPGLVLPLGVGLAAHSLYALAGGAAITAVEFTNGPAGDLRDVARAVVRRTTEYLEQNAQRRGLAMPLPWPVAPRGGATGNLSPVGMPG